MTTRGKTIKQETPARLTLLRPMVTRRYELTADHEKCCGCKLCEIVCPREAITLSKADLGEGRVIRRAQVDISAEKCSFCGECVVVCPTHALAMTVNGQPEIPAVKGDAFPVLRRQNVVDQIAARASTDVAYVTSCPVGAISVTAQHDTDGSVVAVEQVVVDQGKCIDCTRCMEEGPAGAFTVTKPYKGHARLNVALCLAGCQACADVCPTHAITYDGHQVTVQRRFCLFCGACEKVCPAPGAVVIERTAILHTPVESGAWVVALEKLVSFREAARELDVKGQEKRRQLLLNGKHLEVGEEGEK